MSITLNRADRSLIMSPDDTDFLIAENESLLAWLPNAIAAKQFISEKLDCVLFNGPERVTDHYDFIIRTINYEFGEPE